MNRRFVSFAIIVAMCVGSVSAQVVKPGEASKAAREIRYLAFQIFCYGPNPLNPTMGEGTHPQPAQFPEKAAILAQINDIKQRIGTVGSDQTRLAVVLGHISFDHTDIATTKFIALGFEIALETNVAVGFHIDDSMFWRNRKDLWSDPKNVEALDWDGTPNTGRALEWQTGPGAKPDAAPPQMCFNSTVIQHEVKKRGTLVGKAISDGLAKLKQHNRPELFAGVVVGSETMIGHDFATHKSLGYRALLNRGFSRANPPKDIDRERESIVQEFIELWTKSLADAGVSPAKLYSHTAFLSQRVFKTGDAKKTSYSEHNHFAPPSVAIGKSHRPGFSTYPQPGLYDDIYALLAEHKQVGWASCEGTNLQLGSGPGQSGMNMETYLAKMFNHGATLVNIFSWGLGGEAHKNMSFRVVTEGEDALAAYRKFLSGTPLIEAKTEGLTLLERLPPKIHRIQKDLPAWIQDPKNATKAADAVGLMKKLQEQLANKNFDEVERIADSLLNLAGMNTKPVVDEAFQETQRKLRHDFGGCFLVTRDKVQTELKLSDDQKSKVETLIKELLPEVTPILQKAEGPKKEEYERAIAAYRPKARGKLSDGLKTILSDAQRARLLQLERQREGLRDGEIWGVLQVSVPQRLLFMNKMQQAQKKIQLLLAELQKTGDIKEIQPRVIKVRDELEADLEAALTDAQKKEWKTMRGEFMIMSNLFDL